MDGNSVHLTSELQIINANSKLVISSANKHHEGSFKCTARNNAGVASRIIDVVVQSIVLFL